MTPSWQVYLQYLVDPRFIYAAATTLAVAIAAQTVGVLLGSMLALWQLSRSSALNRIAYAYVWLWRGTPPLIQLLLLYFGLPQLGLRLNVLEAGIIGLGCYAAAYMSEIIRTGILSVDRGEVEAAWACGFGRWRTLRHIVMPQAIRVILPPFGNEFSSMMRTTSLLSVISFEELLRVTTLTINEVFRPIEIYAVAASYYLAMTTTWMLVQIWLERRASVGSTARLNITTAPI